MSTPLEELDKWLNEDTVSQPPTPVEDTIKEEVDTSIPSALQYALDQPLENIGLSLKTLGAEGVGQWLQDITDYPEDYEAATEHFINSQGEGFEWGYLPRAAVEQAGQIVGSLATRVAGAGIGGAVGGPPGAVFGALIGPGLFEAVQVVGPIALERARNREPVGVDKEITAEDWSIAFSTAISMGALNAVGIKGLGDVLKTGPKGLPVLRTLFAGGKETGTEGIQSVLEQAGSTVGTDVGLEIDLKQATGEGILGGTAAGGTQAIAETVANSVYAQTETVDELDALIEQETQRRLDEGDYENLEKYTDNDLRDVIEDMGHEITVLPGESREDVLNKLKGFVKQDVTREFVFEDQSQALGSAIIRPAIRRVQQERFNAMPLEDLATFVEEQIGAENYANWASVQGTLSFDPDISPANNYQSDRDALAAYETNRLIRRTLMPSKLDQKGIIRYTNNLMERNSREQLIELALNIEDMQTGELIGRTSLEKMTNEGIAAEIAQMMSIMELQQEKFSNLRPTDTVDTTFDLDELLTEDKSPLENPLVRREVSQGGNARTAMISLVEEGKTPIEIAFAREGLEGEISENIPTYGAKLVLAREQKDPRAQEYIEENNVPALTPLEAFLQQTNNTYLTSLELPQGAFPKMQLDPINKIMGTMSEWFRPYGPLGLDVGRRRHEYIAEQKAIEKEAQNLAYEHEKAVVEAIRSGQVVDKETADRLVMAFLRRTGAHLPLTEDRRVAIQEDINELLAEQIQEPSEQGKEEIGQDIEQLEILLEGVQKTEVAMEQLPEILQRPAMKIRTSIDALSTRLMEEMPPDVVTPEHKMSLREGINTYVTRSFALFETGLGWNPKYSKWWNNEAENIYKRAIKSVYHINRHKPNYTEAKAKRYVNDLLSLENFHSTRDLAKLPGILTATTDKLQVDNPGRLLESRAYIPYSLRKLMGEIEQPEQVVMTSLSRLGKLVSMASFYSDVREINERPGEMLFTSKPIGRYKHRIESNEFNPLSDYYTTNEVAQILGVERNDPANLKNTFFSIYDLGIVLPKLAAQVGMIVISPATQIRNFIGGGLMFVAAGYSGRNGLPEAIEMVKHDLFGTISYKDGRLTAEGKKAKRNFQKMQDLGIVNTSVRLNEATDLFAKLSDSGRNSSVSKISHFLQTMKNTPTGKVLDWFGPKQFRGLQRTYAAGDDFWKIAAFSADRRRLKEMLNKLEPVDNRQNRINELIEESQLEENIGNNFKLNEIQSEISQLEQDIVDNPQLTTVSDDVKLKVLENYASKLTTKLGTTYKSNLAATLRQTTNLEDYIDEVAAYHVRMQIPNYDYVGKFAQVVKQLPIGAFIAFPTEILRVSGNIAQISAKQLTYKIPDQIMEEGGLQKQKTLYKNPDGSETLGLPTGQRPLLASGVKKAFLGAASMYGLGAVMQAVMQYHYDIEDEELEAASEVLPDWAEDSRIIPISGIKEDGGFDYINSDYTLPFEGIANFALTVQNSIKEGEYEGEGIPRSVVEGMAEWVMEYLHAYTQPGIATKVQAELILNQDLDTGQPIYTEGDNWGDILVDMVEHSLDEAGPGLYRDAKRIEKSMREGDDRYDKYLQDEETAQAIARLFGISASQMNLERASVPIYVSNQIQGRLENIERNLGEFRWETATREEVLEQWEQSQDQWFEAQQNIYFQIQSWIALGVDKRTIRKQLDRVTAGVPGSFKRNIMNGVFTAYEPSKDISKKFKARIRDKKKLEKEAGRDPANITGKWPTNEIRTRTRELNRAKYDLKKFPSLPHPWED